MDDSTIRVKCQSCGAHTIIIIAPGILRTVICPVCGTRVVEFESLRRFVYVLSNPQMPNLLKIGFTTRQVEDRVAELSAATSVRGPFVIEAVFPSSEPELHEATAHETLADVRLESKEFFKVGLVNAIRTVSAICGPAAYLRIQDLLNERQPPRPNEPQPPRPRTPRKSRLSPADEAKKLLEWQERMFRK